jgi:hypothetical protein
MEGHLVRRQALIDGALTDGLYDDAKGSRLVERVIKGDKEAGAALSFIACEHINLDLTLPPILKAYIIGVLLHKSYTPEPLRGGDPSTHVARNIFIVELVERLRLDGFSPTRNRYTRTVNQQESGCSITAKVLDRIGIRLSERRVEEVWENRREIWKLRGAAIEEQKIRD